MEFEVWSLEFLVDFLRYSFGKIKVILTVVEREYTLDITLPIMRERNFPKAKFKIRSPKINRGTLIVTLLNFLKY